MQVYLTLLRRELSGYFASVTGYFVIATVLLLLGLSFSDMLGKLNNEATDAPVTEEFFVTIYYWLILLLTAPIMTMRSFASEKSSGTFETLMTSPVGDLEVVLAKFSGALLFYGLTWLPLLVYLMIIRRYSNDASVFDARILLSTCIGMVLVGSLYISLGCLASALSRSQIIAAIISYAFGLALFLLSLRALVAARPSGWKAKLFSYISTTEHMQEFARGTVDTRYLVFYLSLTVFFLFLTLKTVESRRWK
jgi:ABC-2 type transport system permease protein